MILSLAMTNRLSICALTLTMAAGIAQAEERFPRHSFYPDGRGLTAASAAPKQDIATRYVRDAASANGLSLEDIAGVYLYKTYRTEHNGIQHFVYRQQFSGLDVWHSDFTLNVDTDGRVINSGGQFYTRPAGTLRTPGFDSAELSLERALKNLHSSRAGLFKATRQTRDPILRTHRFRNTVVPTDSIDGDPMWYPVNGTLRPIWMFYIQDDNGVDRWATPVDSESGFVFPKDSLTFYQQARVYDKVTPQPSPTPGVASTVAPPYVDRTLQPLTGDPTASPKGWVIGNVTAGNNVVAGPNPHGITFDPTVQPIAGDAKGNFDFPLQLGPGMPNPGLFAEAEVTNLFYWANKAHDSFYAMGFDEQAGAYQADNYGKGGVDGDPMYAFSQYGSQANGFANLNNAFYTTTRTSEDGSQGSINMFVAGNGTYRVFTDGSYDGSVITHEYTHGVSTRLIRNFSNTGQMGAMSEAWSYFYAFELTLPEGAPPDGVYVDGEYFIQSFGKGIRTYPFTTDIKRNPLTYNQLGQVISFPEVHADGEIWMAALWDMRSNLIEQFGDKEGRRRVRQIVLDAMKLSPPAPTMVDMRDAILLADQQDFKGASQTQIWKAFVKRGLGALAYSIDPTSTFIATSFDMPSTKGQLRFYQDEQLTGETARIVLQDSNLTSPNATVQITSTSGDLEDVILRRVGGIYYGTMVTTTASTRQRNNAVTAIPGDYLNVYYNDGNTGDGSAAQASASVLVRQNYTPVPYAANYPRYTFNRERALFGFPVAESAIRVELPFDFPYYGQKFRRAWVSTDGILSFGKPEFGIPCPSHAALGAAPAIAPAFTNLLLGLDPTQDVFMSTGDDFVTFHWVGLTQPNQFLLASSPVDFNATLFNDGRILFQYGAGNTAVLADHLYSVAFGCDAPGAVVGISPGHDGNYTTSIYADGFTNLDNARTIAWLSPYTASSVPVAALEAPAEGSAIKDILTLTGYAGDTNNVIGVDILIDGMMRGTLGANAQRTDICSKQMVPGCPFIGFTTDFSVASLQLAPGAHTVQLHARNYQGGITVFPDKPVTFMVDGSPSRLPVGKIEAPLDGASVTGTVPVTGYVYAPDLRISSVTVLVDGLSYTPASLSVTRNDICAALPAPAPPNCPRIGFQVGLNTASTGPWLTNGDHKMQLRVQDSLGRITILPDTPVNFTVKNTDRVPSTGVLESPAPSDTLTGMIDLKGYGYSVGGRITSALILVDGSSVGTLTYGGARLDACASLPDVTACPNVGFTGTLDTRRFSNGPHVLGVYLVNATGSGTIIPALAANGMVVNIQN